MLTENFLSVLQAASMACDVSCDDILSNSKRLEVVDARSVVVKILFETGYCPCRIARMLRKTEASIRYTITNMDQRFDSNKILKKMLSDTRKILENK